MEEQAMTMNMGTSPTMGKKDLPLSLCQLLDPEVLANPYPLYHRLRNEAPVHWDPFLHTWVVTRYVDVVSVLQHFSANRTPTPEQLTALSLSTLVPIAEVGRDVCLLPGRRWGSSTASPR